MKTRGRLVSDMDEIDEIDDVFKKIKNRKPTKDLTTSNK